MYQIAIYVLNEFQTVSHQSSVGQKPHDVLLPLLGQAVKLFSLKKDLKTDFAEFLFQNGFKNIN